MFLAFFVKLDVGNRGVFVPGVFGSTDKFVKFVVVLVVENASYFILS